MPADNRIGHTPQEHIRDGAPPLRSDDNQQHILLTGGTVDLLKGDPFAHEYLCFEAEELQLGSDVLLSAAIDAVELLQFVFEVRPELAHVLDVQHNDFFRARRSELLHQSQRLACTGRKIGRQKDAVEGTLADEIALFFAKLLDQL